MSSICYDHNEFMATIEALDVHFIKTKIFIT